MMFMPPRRVRTGPLTIGELQGFPKARRVIFESREATLWSLQGSSGDGWGAEGLTVLLNAAVHRWERCRLSISENSLRSWINANGHNLEHEDMGMMREFEVY